MVLRDIPGGAKYGHLRATAIGMTVSGLPADLRVIPVSSLRCELGEFLFPLVEISSQRHAVRRRQMFNLVTRRVQADLLNIDNAGPGQVREMLAAGAVLNEYIEKRGKHQHVSLPIARQQVVDAIRCAKQQRLPLTQLSVISILWPDGGGMSDRQFRNRLGDPELFPDQNWSEIIKESLHADS
jgi:hypothetical protein